MCERGEARRKESDTREKRREGKKTTKSHITYEAIRQHAPHFFHAERSLETIAITLF